MLSLSLKLSQQNTLAKISLNKRREIMGHLACPYLRKEAWYRKPWWQKFWVSRNSGLVRRHNDHNDYFHWLLFTLTPNSDILIADIFTEIIFSTQFPQASGISATRDPGFLCWWFPKPHNLIIFMVPASLNICLVFIKNLLYDVWSLQ